MEWGKELKILEDANEIQKELLDVIDNNNKITSGHNKLMLWLTGVIVFLTIITLFSNYSKKGRYGISGNLENGTIILDTRTGQAWLRQPRMMYDLGTIDKPKFDKTKRVLRGGLSGTSTIEEITDK
ncbi:MAG: hypothetical protein ACYS9Y_13495 [Planctomycetota bacterium]|jgi:hypothetical protein